MNFWIDAQLPPSLAFWLTATFGVTAMALRDLELRDAGDLDIFNAARNEIPRRKRTGYQNKLNCIFWCS
jgi:predicted nuclease of predicted toxin-antitoxin system